MLATEDLAPYKVIYISGSLLPRAAARKLADWVKQGGTLYTCGGGLARDEANQPLDVIHPVLGLKDRKEPEMWCDIRRHGAVGLGSFASHSQEAVNAPSSGIAYVPMPSWPSALETIPTT
jgi:hypothetical protein